MPGEEKEFDVEAAVGEIADGLGFEEEPAEPTKKEEEGESEKVVVEGEDGKSEPPAEPIADGEKALPTEESSVTEPPASEGKKSAPRTWRKEASQIWDKIPPEAQDEILKREDDIFRGIEKYKVVAKTGEAFHEAVAPYMPIYQKYGVDPVQQAGKLFEAHMTLSTASQEQKLAMFQKLAEHYQVPLDKVAYNAPYVDPQTQELNNRIQQLEAMIQGSQQAQATAVRQTLEQELDQFANDPANVYFNDVAAQIAVLLSSKQAGSLKEAYEQAIWLNPAVRAKELARQQAEEATKAQKLAADKAKAAKEASAVNVKTTTKQASGTAPLGSIDDTLTETLAAIKAKS